MNLVTIPHASTTPTKTPVGLSALALIGLTQAGVFAGIATGSVWLFAVSAIAGVLVDLVTDQLVAVRLLLNRAHIGVVARSLVRDVGLVAVMARTLDHDLWPYVGLAGAALAVPVLRGALLFLDTPLERRVLRPVAYLNMEVPAVGVNAREVPLPRATTAILLGAAPLLGGCVGLVTGSWWLFAILAGAYIVVFVGWGAWAAWALWGARKVARRDTFRRHVNEYVNEHVRPEAVLYFSGSADAVYQANMWLRTMERIGHPVMVILRERANLALLAPTTLPVIVIPKATDLMAFRLPTVRVAFYVAHVGKNIHLQREPRMKHVFIGHGESDKVASINPISKGFDEIWVAGPASTRRWQIARVGVSPESIREVGRPQIGGIDQGEPRGGRPFSVLYAPTWEGWTKDPAASSVPAMGLDLVTWLLQRPDTRVIYRPHPLTGTVSTKAAAQNAAIMAAIEAHAASGSLPAPATADDWQRCEGNHLVITDPAVPLYECFNHADMLIGDISSVVPDFLASGKPYAVPNPASRDHDELRDQLASTRAGAILDPDPQGWAAVLDDACGPDTFAQARRELRADLLGPYWPDPIQPWNQALGRLIDRANAEWPGAAAEVRAGLGA